MTKSTRIKSKPASFNIYLQAVVAMLLTAVSIAIPPVYNWQNLGLTSDEMDKIKAFLKSWWSGISSAPGAYELHTNMYGITKTKDTRKQVLKIIKDFSVYFNPLLTRMAGSPNITSAIREVLNIADPNPHHGRHNEVITEYCYVKIIAMGGGKMHFKCSSETDATRASMLTGMGDLEIEIIYSVTLHTIDTTGKVIPPLAPTGWNDTSLNIQETSTKASFYLSSLPENSVEKTLQGYACWKDVHNPTRKGPYTPLPPTVIR